MEAPTSGGGGGAVSEAESGCFFRDGLRGDECEVGVGVRGLLVLDDSGRRPEAGVV